VTAANHTTGTVYQATSLRGGYSIISRDLKLNASRPEFTYAREATYEAQLMDASGKVVMQSQGRASHFRFNTSRLANGVYMMRVNIDGTPVATHQYAITAR
jgi:hypothetical protein